MGRSIFNCYLLFTTNDIAKVLDNFDFDDDIQGADIHFEALGNGKVSDVDISDEEQGYFHNLSRRQLLAPSSLALRRPFAEGSTFSNDEEPDSTPSICH